MGHQVTTTPDTDREPTTRTDQPGPGTRGAQRVEQDRRQQESRGFGVTGWVAAFLVALVAIAAAAFALSGTADDRAVQARSNTDEVAAIQDEKQVLAAGREEVADTTGGLTRDDTATLQAEKEALQATTDVQDEIAVQAEKDAFRAGTTADPVAASVLDDPATLAQEKADVQGDRGQDEVVVSNDAVTLQQEKEQALDRADQQTVDVPSQADESAALTQEKALIG